MADDIKKTKELIFFIHGFGNVAQSIEKDRMVSHAVAAAETKVLNRMNEQQQSDNEILLDNETNQNKIKIIEAYWSDMVPSLSHQPQHKRFTRGFNLVTYWFFSSVWSILFKHSYLTINVLFSGLVLLLWYVGVVLLFAEAYSGEFHIEGAVEFSHWVNERLAQIGNWHLWVSATIFLAIVPTHMIIDLMDFSKRYISKEKLSEESISLRQQILSRVKGQLLQELKKNHYDRVTILAHSFGTIVALDFLADVPLDDDINIRFITCGSPYSLLSKRAGWLVEEKEKCLARPQIKEWFDYTQKSDWLSTGIDFTVSELQNDRVKSIQLGARGDFSERISGANHSRYFDHQVVAETLFSHCIRKRQTL